MIFRKNKKKPFLNKVNGGMCAKFQVRIVFRLARKRDTNKYTNTHIYTSEIRNILDRLLALRGFLNFVIQHTPAVAAGKIFEMSSGRNVPPSTVFTLQTFHNILMKLSLTNTRILFTISELLFHNEQLKKGSLKH